MKIFSVHFLKTYLFLNSEINKQRSLQERKRGGKRKEKRGRKEKEKEGGGRGNEEGG